MSVGVISIEDVAQAVAAEFRVPEGSLTGVGRTAGISAARQVAFALAYELTGQSLPAIGRFFGRDHTTVLYGVARFRSVHKVKYADLIARARLRAVALSRPEFVRHPSQAVFRSVRGDAVVTAGGGAA